MKRLYCIYCGQLITEQPEDYRTEYPQASQEAYEHLVREHWERDDCQGEEILFDGYTGKRL